MPTEITSQNADTIYNVAGNLNLHNSPEVLDLLNQQKQSELRELYSTPFLEVLSKNMSEKVLLHRKNEITKIKKALKSQQQLFLHGEPGIGKTTTLFQLTNTIEKVVYISVKDKSPINILSYLINKIRQSNNDILIEIKDVNEGFEWLQASLQKTESYFIIDDCEQDISTVSKVVALEKFNSTFLYATRNKSLFEKTGKAFYECQSFSDSEIRAFLKLHGKQLQTLDFNRLRTASKGNPLYLFYFTNFPISPLPEDLTSFQQVIWGNLTPSQQEILALVAVPHFSLNTAQLIEVLSFGSPLEFSNKIDELSALINNLNGSLYIFHPSFKEFILEILKTKGFLEHYLTKLGDYFLSKNEIVQATYLLLDIAPEKVDKYLYDVFPRLLSWGELQFAVKVLNRKLVNAEKDIDKGYIYFHLSNANNLLGNKEQSRSNTDQSIFHLKKAKNKRFLAAAMMFKATNLIDEGKISEANKIADKVFSDLKVDDKKTKAPLLVTLAKIYVDMSETNKAAQASKEAFEIFEELGDRYGMISSLVNLVSSLAQNDTYRDDAEKYGLQLLEIIGDETEFSVEVIVLNSLTSIYREKKEFEKAKEYCQRAIMLCQKYEMKGRVILNLINYGNIVRDEGKIDEAKKIYQEALIYTSEYNLKKDEGRVYWILASIEMKEENLEIALGYAEKSIETCQSVNYYYGVANASREKAEILELMGKPKMAALAYQNSAEFYGKLEQYNPSYRSNLSKSINLFNSIGAHDEANILTTELIENAFRVEDFEGISDVITANPTNESIGENFKILFKNYFSHTSTHGNIIQEFLSFIEFCKSNVTDGGHTLYYEILTAMIESGFVAKYSYSTLATAIEQSEQLLSDTDLDNLYIQLQKHLPFISARYVDGELVILTSIAGKINLEIHTHDDELVCKKLALALLLLIHERPDLVLTDIEMLEKKCPILLNAYGPEMEQAVGSYFPPKDELFSEHTQSVHMGKTDYEIYDMIVVNPNYEENCNLTKNPEGKGSMYFYTNTLIGIKEHLYHLKIRNDFKLRRPLVNIVANLLGYTDLESEKDRLEKFAVDISKLSEKVQTNKLKS